jgi:hypothetical protein
MLITCFLNDLEMVPVAPIITGVTFAFTFHMRFVSIVRCRMLVCGVGCFKDGTSDVHRNYQFQTLLHLRVNTCQR